MGQHKNGPETTCVLVVVDSLPNGLNSSMNLIPGLLWSPWALYAQQVSTTASEALMTGCAAVQLAGHVVMKTAVVQHQKNGGLCICLWDKLGVGSH